MPDYRYEKKVFEGFPINSVVQFYIPELYDFRNAVVIGYSLSDKNELLVDCKVICQKNYEGQTLFSIDPKNPDTQLAGILTQAILFA